MSSWRIEGVAIFTLLVSALVSGPASGAAETGGPAERVAAARSGPADADADADDDPHARLRDPAAALAAAVEDGGAPDEADDDEADDDDEDDGEDEAEDDGDGASEPDYDPLEGVDLRDVPRLDPPKTRRDEIREYWRSGSHGGIIGSVNLFYGGPVRAHTFAGAPLRSRLTLGIALKVLFRPRVLATFAIRGQGWESVGPGPTLDARALFVEFGYGLPLLALPTDWRVRPEVLALIAGGAGTVHAGFGDPTGDSVQNDDLDRLTVGLTAALEAHVDVHVHKDVVVRAFGGLSRSLYNFGALNFARDAQWYAGLGVGLY